MNTSKFSFLEPGLIARPAYRILIYAWHVTITMPTSEGAAHRDMFYFNSLVEAATQSVSPMSHADSWVRLQNCSRGLITPSIFPREPDLLTLQMIAAIELSGRSLTSRAIVDRRCMLAVPNRIDFAGSIATISHIRGLTFSALNLFSDEQWHEPQPGYTVSKKVTRTFSHDLGTPMAGLIAIGNPPRKPTKEFLSLQLTDTQKTR